MQLAFDYSAVYCSEFGRKHEADGGTLQVEIHQGGVVSSSPHALGELSILNCVLCLQQEF